MSRVSATVFATTVPRARVQVGVNYPWAWNKSGLYFGGGGPPRSNATMMGWLNTLKPNLDKIQAAGVNLVRIFLLCNMSNLGEAKALGRGRAGSGRSVRLRDPSTRSSSNISRRCSRRSETARCR